MCVKGEGGLERIKYYIESFYYDLVIVCFPTKYDKFVWNAKFFSGGEGQG